MHDALLVVHGSGTKAVQMTTTGIVDSSINVGGARTIADWPSPITGLEWTTGLEYWTG